MLVLQGTPAATDAALDKKLRAILGANPGVRAIEARYVHLVALEPDASGPGVLGGDELEPASRAVLEKLLTYGPRAEAGTRGVFTLVVGAGKAGWPSTPLRESSISGSARPARGVIMLPSVASC